MCYNAITGSAPSYLSELLHLYSPSHSLRSVSDTRMLKIQRFNRETHGFCTFSHFGPHIWNNLPQNIRHSATLSSFKSQLKTFLWAISLLRIFQLSHIVLHSYQSVQCVCVCIFCIAMRETLSISFFWITFSISMYIMCVCLFSTLNRRVGTLQISFIIIIISVHIK